MLRIKNIKKLSVIIVIVTLLSMTLATSVFASTGGDASAVSSAIESTWTDASTQIKTVVNNVVFPAINLILAVFFFGKLGMSYFDYKKQGQFDWTAPAMLFVCLVFSMTAPLYIWGILGM